MMLPIFSFDAIESTQSHAKQLVDQHQPPFLVTAKSQIQGRGRYDRQWYSPAGNFYGTVVMPIEDQQQAMHCTIHMANKICEALQTFNTAIGLKWPNDIVHGPYKVGGMLTEHIGKLLYLGIGVNIATTPQGEFRWPVSSLKELCNEDFSAQIVMETLLIALSQSVYGFKTVSYDAIYKEYIKLCTSLHRYITIWQGNHEYTGKLVAINNDYTIDVETEHGKITCCYGDAYHMNYNNSLID